MLFLKDLFSSSSEPKVDFFNSLQEMIVSKREYCNSINTCLKNSMNCLNDFKIRLKNISSNLNDIEVSSEDKNIHYLIKSIYRGIMEKFEESANILKEMNLHFTKYEKNLKEEIKIHKEYKDIFNQLQKEKKSFEKRKEVYYNSGKEMDYAITQFVSHNIHVLDQISQNEFYF